MGCGSSAVKAGKKLVADGKVSPTDDVPQKANNVDSKPNPLGSESNLKHILDKHRNGITESSEKVEQKRLQDVPENMIAEKPKSSRPPAPQLNWDTADKIAKDCPLNIRKTVDHLTGYFKEHVSCILLARAIFRWITSHLIWRPGGSQEPASVLRKGGGEDLGFSELFVAMCQSCDLSAKVVKGYVKDNNYIPGANVEKYNYWNVLCIDDVCYVVDCCRGAGIIRDEEFEPFYNEYYWLPKHSDILYTHLPDEEVYQCCQKTYTKTEWLALPKTTSLYSKCNVELISELRSVYEADRNGLLQMTFSVPTQYVCICEISRLHPKQKLPQSYSYVSQDEEQCTMYTGYPYPGEYIIRLLIKDRSDRTPKVALEFSVKVATGRGTDPLYPVLVDMSRQVLLVGPLMGELVKNMSAYFHCKVKGAEQVSILVGEEICPLKRISDNKGILMEAKRAKVKHEVGETSAVDTAVPEAVENAAAENTPSEAKPNTELKENVLTQDLTAANALPADEVPKSTDPAEALSVETKPNTELTENVLTQDLTAAKALPADEVPKSTDPAEALSVEETKTSLSQTAQVEAAQVEAAQVEAAQVEAVPGENEPSDAACNPGNIAPAEIDILAEAMPAALTESSPSMIATAKNFSTEVAPSDTVALSKPIVSIELATTEADVAKSEVTSVWAGEVVVSGREVYLAAFFPDSHSNDYTKLIKFTTKVI